MVRATDHEQTDAGRTPAVNAHSMEQVLTHLSRFRAATLRELARWYGPRDWQVAPNVPAFGRAAVDDDDRPDAETVSLGTVYFDGAYPASLRRSAADTVARTGESFGFTELVIQQDSTDGIAFAGRHPDGHTYRFGIGATTVLSVRSGPAEWAGEPYTDPPEEPRR
ncbi:LppA family lipoprotein [Pseudactinotalea sp. Z1739]|uniref:LppA family lipoprotein n=1 Tax=Pseudactinotalea sp. Z1739 TaxID=3413028 RepID=UPI003C7BCB0E